MYESRERILKSGGVEKEMPISGDVYSAAPAASAVPERVNIRAAQRMRITKSCFFIEDTAFRHDSTRKRNRRQRKNAANRKRRIPKDAPQSVSKKYF